MKKKQHPRVLRKIFILVSFVTVILLVLLCLLYFNFNAEQLKARVIKSLGTIFCNQCKFNVENVSYTVSKGFEVKGFTLFGRNCYHGKPFLRINKALVDPKYRTIFNGAVAFNSLTIDGGDIVLECSEKKGWNCLNLFREQEKKKVGEKGQKKKKETTGKIPGIPDRVSFKNMSFSFCRSCLAGLLDLTPGEIPENYLKGDIAGEIKPETILFSKKSLAKLLKVNPNEVPRILVGKTDKPEKQLSLKATLSGSLLKKVWIVGGFSRTRRWLYFSLLNLQLNSEIMHLLPKVTREKLVGYKPSSTVDLRVAIRFDGDEKPKISIDGKISNGQLLLPYFPRDIRHIKGFFSFDGKTIVLKKMQGNMGEGQIDLNGSFAISEGGVVDNWKADVAVDRIVFDDRLVGEFPPDIQKGLKKIDLDGQFGIEAELSYKDKLFKPQGKITLYGMDFVWQEVPYAIHDIKGTLVFDNDRIQVPSPITGSHDKVSVQITGSADLQDKGKCHFKVALKDLPFDKYLRSCLAPKARKIWDSFKFEGTGDADIKIERESGEKDFAVTTVLTGKSAKIYYDYFPYVIEGIKGKLIISNDRVEVLDLSGYHDDTYITCPYGYWKTNPDDGEDQFRFEFNCAKLPIDKDLSLALPPTYREVLKDFQLQGEVKTKVNLYRRKSAKNVSIEIDADFINGRIKYFKLPYPLRLKSGKINISPGLIQVTDLKAEGNDLSLCCETGTIEDLKDKLKYNFTLKADKLNPSPRLIAALPEHVSKLLTNLSIQGEFAARSVWILFEHSKKDLDDFLLNYSIKDLMIRNMSLNAGMKFRQIMGNADLIIGKSGKDLPHKATGEVTIKSMRFHGMKFQDLLLEGTYGARHALLNAMADNKKIPGIPPFNNDLFLTRIPDDKEARNWFQVWICRGNVYNGDLKGFIAADVGGKKDVAGQVFVKNMDMSLASKDLFKKGRASGKAFADAYFWGNIEDINTLKGEGKAYMEDANLVKLPMFLSIFRDVLKFQSIKQSYFHRVSVSKFNIKNGRFVAPSWDSISMKSDLMTMRGGGSVDFDLNLDLYLSLPSFGPAIPIVSDIWRRIIDNLVGFHVTGNIDNPKIVYMPIRDILALFRND